MSDLDEYLQAMQSEGRTDSSGRFTFDLKRAQEKLGHFFEAIRHDFIHYWIRFAVFFEAPEIVLSASASDVTLEFSGHGPELSAVEGLFGQRELGLRYLQLGVIGALRQGFDEVELDTPHFAAHFGANRQSLHERPGAKVCRLRASKALRGVSILGRQVRHWLRAENAPLPPRDLPYLKTALQVRGKPRLPAGFTDPHHLHLTTDRLLSERLAQSAPVFFMGDKPESGIQHLHIVLISSPARGWRDRHPRAGLPQLVILVHGQHFRLGAELSCHFPPDAIVLIEPEEVRFDLALRNLSQPALSELTLQSALAMVTDRLARVLLGARSMSAHFPLAAAEWLSYRLTRENRAAEAAQVGEALLERLAASPANPFAAALLERTQLLAARLSGQPDAAVIKACEKAWAALEDSADFNWSDLLHCGAVRTPDAPWITRACRDLNRQQALAFFRETVIRSVLPQRTNPALLATLPPQPLTFLESFLVVRHLLKQKPAPTWYRRALYCASFLLSASSGYRVSEDLADISPIQLNPQLEEGERRSIWELVDEIALSGVEALEEGEAALAASIAASSQSHVQLSRLRQEKVEMEDWSWPIKFKLSYLRALVHNLSGRVEEGQRLLRALHDTLAMAAKQALVLGKSPDAYLELAKDVIKRLR